MTVNTIAPQKLNPLTARSFFRSLFPQSRTGRKDNPTSTVRRAVGRVCGPLKRISGDVFFNPFVSFFCIYYVPSSQQQTEQVLWWFLETIQSHGRKYLRFRSSIRPHTREGVNIKLYKRQQLFFVVLWLCNALFTWSSRTRRTGSLINYQVFGLSNLACECCFLPHPLMCHILLQKLRFHTFRKYRQQSWKGFFMLFFFFCKCRMFHRLSQFSFSFKECVCIHFVLLPWRMNVHAGIVQKLGKIVINYFSLLWSWFNDINFSHLLKLVFVLF